MKAGSIMKMDGEVEADESFIGGLAKNMHEKKRRHIGTGGAGKTAVLGILRRKNSSGAWHPTAQEQQKREQSKDKGGS